MGARPIRDDSGVGRTQVDVVVEVVEVVVVAAAVLQVEATYIKSSNDAAEHR